MINSIFFQFFTRECTSLFICFLIPSRRKPLLPVRLPNADLSFKNPLKQLQKHSVFFHNKLQPRRKVLKHPTTNAFFELQIFILVPLICCSFISLSRFQIEVVFYNCTENQQDSMQAGNKHGDNTEHISLQCIMYASGTTFNYINC